MISFTATYRYQDIRIIAHNLLCPLFQVSGNGFAWRECNPPALPCGPMLTLEITRYHICCSVTGFMGNSVPQPFFISENLDTQFNLQSHNSSAIPKSVLSNATDI